MISTGSWIRWAFKLGAPSQKSYRQSYSFLFLDTFLTQFSYIFDPTVSVFSSSFPSNDWSLATFTSKGVDSCLLFRLYFFFMGTGLQRTNYSGNMTISDNSYTFTVAQTYTVNLCHIHFDLIEMKTNRFNSHSMKHVNHIFCSDISRCPTCVGTATQTTDRRIYCP